MACRRRSQLAPPPRRRPGAGRPKVGSALCGLVSLFAFAGRQSWIAWAHGMSSSNAAALRGAVRVDTSGRHRAAGVGLWATGETDDALEEARMAAEAAKLRLEAERLKVELDEVRRASGFAARVAEPEAAPVASRAPDDNVVTAGGAAALGSPMPSRVVAGEAALALVEDSSVQGAANALLRLLRSADGEASFGYLMNVVVTKLEEASNTDYTLQECRKVLGDASLVEAWNQAGVDVAEAQDAICGAVDLFIVRGSPSSELKSARAARATALRLIIHDQLPDLFKGYARFIKLQGSVAQRRNEQEFLIDNSLVQNLKPEEKEAADFGARLENLPSEEARARSGLERFRQMPLMREVSSLLQADPGLSELARAFSPWEVRLYSAAHKVQYKALPEEERKKSDELEVVEIQLGPPQLLGILVVIAALAFFAASGVKNTFFPERNGDTSTRFSQTRMPLYGLKDANLK
mmetsp:Transcript_99114/g.258957  ORF Transcript_99114/g.258957 Transcript_99114/m.258957 type:complete len:465 (-) Transcript_99114:132-1526(-)